MSYKYIILHGYLPETVFTWARIWGSVVIFRSQKGSANKRIWKAMD